jgi:glycosyltransferase involved in cell wall biosynthesis
LLKVAVDARSLLCREPRGEGKSLLSLYEALMQLDPGLQAVFFGDESGTQYAGPLPPRTGVQLLSTRGQRFEAWENWRLPWAARGFSVLHCTSSGTPPWAPVPIVMTVHDLIPMLLNDGQTAAAREQFRRRLARGAARACAVIAVSEHTRTDLVRAFPRAQGRVHVIPWGAPAAAPAQPPQADPPYVLAFGGMAPRKNTMYTLERFGAAAPRVPGLQLVLAGISNTAQRAALQQRAAVLGVAGRLRMPGFVAEEELPALLGRATAVLYLSQYEGFGLPLLEAVAHGVPAIASDRSSIPEVLSDGGSCHALEDPAAIEAAIVRIVSDPGYRSERVAAQAKALARFNWADTAAATHALLAQAAAGA